MDNDEPTLLDGPNALPRARTPMSGAARPEMPPRAPMGGGRVSNAAEVRASVEYKQYERMGNEIRNALLQVRKDARASAAAAAAPRQAVTCPWCGATTTPDASGCCEYCGGAING